MEPEQDRAMTPEEAHRDRRRMVRFLVSNALFGTVVGAAVAGVLIWFNVGAVGTHISRSTDPLRATAVVVIPLALVFGGGAIAAAIVSILYRRKHRR